MVCMTTLATFGDWETSAKNPAGPPGASRLSMNPQIRRAKPSATCTVESANIATATQKITGEMFRARRKRTT